MFVLSSGGEFNMDISDDSASGFIKIGQDVIQFENFNVKHNNFATLIFAPPDFKILIKNISPTEKIIFAKDGDNTAKYKISLEPQTRVVSNQRDLLDEQNNYSSDEETTSTTFKQQQLLDKQNMLRESEKIYQEQLKRITDHNKKSGDSILNYFEKAKIQTGPDLVIPEILEKQPVEKKIKETKNFEIVIFGKNTHNVQQQNDFIFSAKVFEFGKKAHLVDSSNDKLVPNVKLTAQLLDPSGKIYKQFNENLETGVFEEKYKIPTNAPTRGEWTLKITAEKDFGSESSFATWENPFFVSEFDQDGSSKCNYSPKSNAGQNYEISFVKDNPVASINGEPLLGFNNTHILPENYTVSLNGSASYDPEDCFDYDWQSLSTDHVISIRNPSSLVTEFDLPILTPADVLEFVLHVGDAQSSVFVNIVNNTNTP